MNTFTITRESADIWTVTSSAVFWSNGDKVDERVALSTDGTVLSNYRAQAIDRAAGRRYILVAPFSICRMPANLERAMSLAPGQSFSYSI